MTAQELQPDKEHQPPPQAEPKIGEPFHEAPLQQRMEIVLGPLPPPDDFRKYNETLPGIGTRMMSLVEDQQKIQADGQAGILANERRKINGSIVVSLSLVALAAFLDMAGAANGSHCFWNQWAAFSGAACTHAVA